MKKGGDDSYLSPGKLASLWGVDEAVFAAGVMRRTVKAGGTSASVALNAAQVKKPPSTLYPFPPIRFVSFRLFWCFVSFRVSLFLFCSFHLISFIFGFYFRLTSFFISYFCVCVRVCFFLNVRLLHLPASCVFVGFLFIVLCCVVSCCVLCCGVFFSLCFRFVLFSV